MPLGPGREGGGADMARLVADDPEAIAFVGDWRSAVTREAMPVLNEAGLAHVSPSNTYIPLTSTLPWPEAEHPAELQPGAARTFVRLVAHDGVLAECLVSLAAESGWSLAVVTDGRHYGDGMAALTRAAAERAGVPVAETPSAADATVLCGVDHDLAKADVPNPIAYDGLDTAPLREGTPIVVGLSDPSGWEAPVTEAAHLVARAVEDAGPDREAVRAAVVGDPRFDGRGDPVDPRCGVWRVTAGGLRFDRELRP